MARYTVAYSEFRNRLSEVDTLRSLALQKERRDPVGDRHAINALCRGSVILLCSHLEAFIKELGELALDSMHARNVPRDNIALPLYYHISKNYIDEVKETSDPEKIAAKIFDFVQNDISYWSRTGPFPQPVSIEKFNAGFSNPGFKKIKAYFNRFGYLDYQRDLASRLQAQFLPTINMVDHLVDTRNKIAHGDPIATKTPSEVKAITLLIQRYCSETDSAFASWWRSNFCSIR